MMMMMMMMYLDSRPLHFPEMTLGKLFTYVRLYYQAETDGGVALRLRR